MGKENDQPMERAPLSTITDYNENRLFDETNISPCRYRSEKTTTDESSNIEKRPKITYRDLIIEVFKDNPYESFTRTEIIEHIKNKYEYYRNKTNWQTTLKRRFNRSVNILFFRVEGTDVADGRYVHRSFFLPSNYRLIRFSNEEKLHMNFRRLDFHPQVSTILVPLIHPANIDPSGFQRNTFPIDFPSVHPPAILEHQADAFTNQQLRDFNQRPLMSQPGLLMVSSGTSSNSFSSMHGQNFSQGPFSPYHQNFQSAQFSYGPNAPYQDDFQSTQHFSLDPNVPYDFQSDQNFPYSMNTPYYQNFQCAQHFSLDPNVYYPDFQSVQFPYSSNRAYNKDFQSTQNFSYFPNSPFCSDFQSVQYFPNDSNLPHDQNFPCAQNNTCFQNCIILSNFSMARDANVRQLLENNPVTAYEVARNQNNSEIQNVPSPLSLTARNANVQSWLENHLSINTRESHGIEEEKQEEDDVTGFDKNATSLYFYSREISILSGEHQAGIFNNHQQPMKSEPGLLIISPKTNWESKL